MSMTEYTNIITQSTDVDLVNYTHTGNLGQIREIGGKGVYVSIGHTLIGLTDGVFHYMFESQDKQ